MPAVVMLAVCGTGCTGDDGASQSSTEPLSSTELGWIRAYSEWTLEVYDDELDHPPGAALVEACRDRLDEVGPPPTERLEAAADRAAEACPLLSSRGSVRRAKDVVSDADDLVVPFFLDTRDLALARAPGEESRADLVLSGLASRLASSDQEVRCWSPEDWRRVVREVNAWTVDSDDASDLYGWQDSDSERIHMRLEQCNVLHRLRTEDVAAWPDDEQVEAADSLDTFVHEVQHVILPDDEESEVECAAAKRLSPVARLLGASSDESNRLARLYVTDVREDLAGEYLVTCPGILDGD